MRTLEQKMLERLADWPEQDIAKLDQAMRQIEEGRLLDCDR